jgi:hypothetical protein
MLETSSAAIRGWPVNPRIKVRGHDDRGFEAQAPTACRFAFCQKILIFSAGHTVSTRSFKKPPGARPIGVSFRPGGAGRSAAAGEVR